MGSQERDVYGDVNPFHLWLGYSSDMSGLAPLNDRSDPESGRNPNLWDSIKTHLGLLNFHQWIAGRRVIELGSGKRELFRDYCVQSGALEYVGVDPIVRTSEESMGSTKVRYEGQDALRFLSREPDNSALVASFMFLCEEMLDKRACRQKGVQPEAVWKELLVQMFRVAYRGQCHICVGNLVQDSPLIETVGFVRSKANSLLLLKPA